MKRIGIFVAGAIGLVVLFVVLVGLPGRRSNIRADFDGLEAAMSLLQSYDYEVVQTRVLPAQGSGGVVVLVGWSLSVSGDELIEYATLGGELILVGDSRGLPSSFTEQQSDSTTTREQGFCTIDELLDTEAIYSGFDSRDLRIEPGDQSCFGSDEFARVVQRGVGLGSITWIGDDEIFTNRTINQLENAELLVRLVGERRRVLFAGDRAVSGITSSPPEQQTPPPSSDVETEKLFDLLPSWVVLALWQLLAAFVVFVWLRSRRLGNPVEEKMPIEVPAAELARSTGRLFQRSGARGLTLSLLRRSFREDCASWVGLSADANADAWVRAVKRTSSVSESDIRQTLYTGGPINDVSLLNYSKKLDSLREECMR